MAKKEEPKELALFLKEPEVLQKYADSIGSLEAAKPYVQSVLIAVAENDALKECTPRSILQASLRAASLGLSCDPAVKQAWLVPYNKNLAPKGSPPKWVKVCQFQPHYMGLRNLAMRTGKYLTINVSPIYEGTRVFEDAITGKHVVKYEDRGNLLYEPEGKNPAYRDVTTMRSGDKDKKVIGWIGYYKAKNGEEKTIYMSVGEIEEHARKYVKDYLDEKDKVKNPNWKDAEKRKVMEMKTVLKALLNWADKSGSVGHSDQLSQALAADEEEDVIDGLTEETPSENQSSENLNSNKEETK